MFLFSYWDYHFGKQWANSNCSDPKELYESIVFKPEDVIREIKFTDWTNYIHEHEYKDLYIHDDLHNGRCFTVIPSYEHSQYGIKEIYMMFHVNSSIYIHTPGMFSKWRKIGSKINVEFGKFYNYEVNHKYHELLDYGGAHCNNDITYQMDACNYEVVENESMEMLGCTTPFGPNKTKICTNSTKGREATRIHARYLSPDSRTVLPIAWCHYPCSYFLVSSKQFEEGGCTYGCVSLNFEQLIQVTKSHYTYSELSMIAEIGGYVGLFLGISVNQIPYSLNVLRASLMRLCSPFYFLIPNRTFV